MKQKFKIIHTEFDDIFSTIYVTCVYVDLTTNEIFYQVIPLDIFNQIDFSMIDWINSKHRNSRRLKRLDKFKKPEELLQKIRQYHLDELFS